MSGFARALGFLTRVPVGTTRDELTGTASWFPLVGAFVGAAIAGAYVGAAAFLPPTAAAGLAVGAGMVLTGALHEDGLADLADALGGHDRDERLRIARDPAHGTYGIAAIAVTIAVRTGVVAGLGSLGAVEGLIAAHALSRSASVAVAFRSPSPAGSGLGASFARGVSAHDVVVSAGLAIAISAAALGVMAIPAVLAGSVGAAAIAMWARRLLGGVNGDALGAVVVVSELVTLLLVVAL